MKKFLSFSMLLMCFSLYAQTTPTTDPTGVGFGAGSPGTPGVTPGGTGMGPATTNPDVSSPPRGNTFPQQQQRQEPVPDQPSTNFPNTTPAFPNPSGTTPSGTNSSGTGVAPGPVGSPSVGP